MQERSFKDLQTLSFQTQFVILKLADFAVQYHFVCLLLQYTYSTGRVCSTYRYHFCSSEWPHPTLHCY